MGFQDYESWLIGVSLAIIGNVCSNLGLNVCKYHINTSSFQFNQKFKSSYPYLQFQKLAHGRRQAIKQAYIAQQQQQQKANNLHNSSPPKHPANGHHHTPNKHANYKSNSDAYQRQDSISLSSASAHHRHPLPVPLPIIKSDKSSSPHIHAQSHNNNNINIEPPKQGSYVCDGYWLLGQFGLVMGGFLDFAALGYAPQSVVAPLGALTLVVNVCISPCMHNEKPSMKTIFATGIIMIGAAVTVAASPREDSVDTIDQIFALYENTSFLIYAVFTGGFITIGWCLTQYYVYLSRHKQRRYTTKYYKQHRFVIAAISGTMGAQNVLFAKSVSTLVVKSIQNKGRTCFAYWETYLLCIALVSTIYFQLRWLNSALKRFSALYVAPLFQAFWITVSVMGGLIVYKEFNDMLLSQKIVFPLGVVVTILGVFYLTTQGQPEKYKTPKAVLSKEEVHSSVHHSPVRHAVNGQKDEEEVGGSASVSDERSTVYFQDEVMDENEKQKHLFDDGKNEDNKTIIGLLQNLGDASIVTGSSLGKLLLDPQNIYKDIAFGQCIEEDQHFKGILSPTLMSEADDEDEEDEEDEEEDSFTAETGASSEQLINDGDVNQIKNIEESLSFLPEIEENMLFADGKRSRSKKSRKQKRRRHSFHDSATDHHSDSIADERYNDRRRRKRKKKQKIRARSASPPLTADEMAPHEVVWEKFTSIFADKKNKDMKLSRYASLETPEFDSKENEPEIEDDHLVIDDDKIFSSIP